MKSSKLQTLSAFVKGVFRGKRKEAAAVETYLKCIPTIQKLIDTHMLGINLKNRVIVLDISLHMTFVPSGMSATSFEKADKRYANFLDNLVAYMNFRLGQMGARDFIDTAKECIHLLVTSKDYRYLDENGNPIPAHLQVEERTILVGLYKNGKVGYREYGGYDGQM
jgi:hypothetical protein